MTAKSILSDDKIKPLMVDGGFIRWLIGIWHAKITSKPLVKTSFQVPIGNCVQERHSDHNAYLGSSPVC